MSKEEHRPISQLVEDIIVWGERIPDLIGQADIERFKRDTKLYLAVWKCAEVVGEASGRLLKTKFATHDPTLRDELRLAADTRNRLTHGYPGVDLAILWGTARQFIPVLVQRVRAAAIEDDEHA